MKTDALVKLRDYWESLRNGRVAPYRAELDPRRFEDVLEHMFILEQLNPDQIRVRLAGMRLCEMMGMEVRGMPPEAFVTSDHRRLFTQHLASVLTTPSVVELDLRTTDTFGKTMKAQMVLLPLRSDFGEITRIMGCIVSARGAMRTPVNFRIDSYRADPIVVTVDDSAGTAQGHGLPGFSEPAPQFAPRNAPPPLRAVVDNADANARTPRRQGHLRIVSGD
ncbi:PAS domain-containing protein [Oceanibium sediminis]|uniref:PAS domain-containing protein n=1 Tax=Oceanibium sediminis TaxID=2026339 RepID=UPI001300988E|nr:PAS domain-containing protein [Oceanibium sediminis]